jgi:hypothetical protein
MAAVIGNIVAGIVQGLIQGITSSLDDDDQRRSAFTQSTVAEGKRQFPQFNWVICHPRHSTDFFGVQGEDWGHSHEELPVTFGTIGYDIFWCKAGTFANHGDGGFINWAFLGFYDRSPDGSVLNFTTPPT